MKPEDAIELKTCRFFVVNFEYSLEGLIFEGECGWLEPDGSDFNIEKFKKTFNKVELKNTTVKELNKKEYLKQRNS